mgnify:CR=1 FL=1
MKQGTQYTFLNSDLDRLLFDVSEGRNPNFEPMVIKSRNDQNTLYLQTPKKQAIEFLKALSTAHQCMVDQSSLHKDELQYQGPSPDEVTLVEMAQKHGYEMVN